MKSTQRSYSRVPALLFGLSLVAALGACNKEDEAAAAEAAKNAVLTVGAENIVIAANGSIMSGPQISGTLEPERKAEMRAEMGGRVLQIYAEQGQSVGAGAVLARIDASGIQDAYNSARSGVTAARNAYDVASRDLSRNQTLLAAGAVAERDIDLSRRAVIAARAVLDDANSRLASAQRQLRSTQVTAPFSGIVSERPVSAGDVVQPGAQCSQSSSRRACGSRRRCRRSSSRRSRSACRSLHGERLRDANSSAPSLESIPRPIRRRGRCACTSPFRTRRARWLADCSRMVACPGDGAGDHGSDSAVDERGISPIVMRIRNGDVERVQVQLGIATRQPRVSKSIAGVQAGDTLLMGAAQGITPGTAVKVGRPLRGQ